MPVPQQTLPHGTRESGHPQSPGAPHDAPGRQQTGPHATGCSEGQQPSPAHTCPGPHAVVSSHVGPPGPAVGGLSSTWTQTPPSRAGQSHPSAQQPISPPHAFGSSGGHACGGSTARSQVPGAMQYSPSAQHPSPQRTPAQPVTGASGTRQLPDVQVEPGGQYRPLQ
jgi:hypothetical protein